MLTKKQQLFVENYLLSFNGTKAAIAAGYSPKTARIQASVMLAKPNIKEEVDKRCLDITGKTMDKIAYLIGYWQSVIDNPAVSQKDRLKASELMAKYLGLFSERVEISGKDGEPIKVIWSD